VNGTDKDLTIIHDVADYKTQSGGCD
jgi:hypothetical protein